MSSLQFPLSRRTMLRGAGAALALPWLEAMTPARAFARDDADSVPRRAAVLYMPNGVRADQWTPTGEGREFELSPTLEPLAHLKDRLLVVTNCWNQGSNFGDGHYVKTSGFLTCTTINKTLGIDLNCNGVSVDQVMAKHVGHLTPIPSLELGIDPVSIGVDRNVGYTRVYGSHIAWSGPTNPLPREVNPRLVFERLFRAGQPKSDGGARRERLLLDRVLDDAKSLQQRLGSADRQRMQEYLQSIRSLEERLARASDQNRSWQPRAELNPADEPAGDVPSTHPEHVRLMLDMIVLAFQTDTTRIATFMFGNAVSNTNFSFLDGVSDAHHETSHHQNDPEKLRQYQLINRWHVEQYAYLLDRLRAIPEEDSNVLDRSMILFGSGLRDGNSHDPHNAPVVVAGSAAGRLEVGQHIVSSRDTPLANLYLSMLHAMGVEEQRFADSTGALPVTHV